MDKFQFELCRGNIGYRVTDNMLIISFFHFDTFVTRFKVNDATVTSVLLLSIPCVWRSSARYSKKPF